MYRHILAECRAETLQMAGDEITLNNTLLVRDVLDAMIFGPALAPALASGSVMASVPGQRLAS